MLTNMFPGFPSCDIHVDMFSIAVTCGSELMNWRLERPVTRRECGNLRHGTVTIQGVHNLQTVTSDNISKGCWYCPRIHSLKYSYSVISIRHSAFNNQIRSACQQYLAKVWNIFSVNSTFSQWTDALLAIVLHLQKGKLAVNKSK